MLSVNSSNLSIGGDKRFLMRTFILDTEIILKWDKQSRRSKLAGWNVYGDVSNGIECD